MSRRSSRLVKWLALAAALIFPSCWWQAATAPARAIETTRRWGRLAPLPASATEINASEWHSMFSGGAYVRFKAPPDAIEAFLVASPGLNGVTVEQFTPKHMLIPYSKSTQFESIDDLVARTKHRHFSPQVFPSWFDPTIRIKGRRYEIPQDKNQYSGEVIVDDVNHVVFIHTSYS
jgi:hypothetical protein